MNLDSGAPFVAKAPRAVAIRTIKKWIQEGSLTRGMPLPSERELAERLEVSRETVRRAIRVLEKEGLIASRGPRTRMVTNLSPKNINDGILQDAVIVATKSIKTYPEHWDTGWIDAITQGILEGVSLSNRHSILLQLKRLGSIELSQLTAGSPTAFMVPDLQGQERTLIPLCHTLKKLGLPVVIYGDYPEYAPFDRVTSDHFIGAYELTRFLIGRGCKRILQLGLTATPNDVYWLNDRRRGYEKAISEAGLEMLPPLGLPHLPGDEGNPLLPSFANHVRLTAGYLIEFFTSANPIDAIMCLSDGEICSVAASCQLHHRTPNKDILIVGYDNYWDPQWDKFVPNARLATADKLNRTIGNEMVKLLLQRTSGELPPEPQCRVIAPKVLLPTA